MLSFLAAAIASVAAAALAGVLTDQLIVGTGPPALAQSGDAGLRVAVEQGAVPENPVPLVRLENVGEVPLRYARDWSTYRCTSTFCWRIARAHGPPGLHLDPGRSSEPAQVVGGGSAGLGPGSYRVVVEATPDVEGRSGETLVASAAFVVGDGAPR